MFGVLKKIDMHLINVVTSYSYESLDYNIYM